MSSGPIVPFRRNHGPLVIRPEEIVVFDDERPDTFTLYLRRGDDMTGARHVDVTNLPLALGIIRAWGTHAPITDERKDRTIPLAAGRLHKAA